MQPFEFSNNAFALALSVFTAIVGLSYPLLLQAIQRIDEKYRSPRIVKMLLNESIYRFFHRFIFVSIVFGLASPFVLELLGDCCALTIVWVAIHTLVTLILLTSTITLVQTILTYYCADDLLNYIKGIQEGKQAANERRESYLLETFDIAKYAVGIDDEKIYRQSMQILYNELASQIRGQFEADNLKEKGIRFVGSQVDVMYQIQKQTCSPSDNFFTRDTALISLWFPIEYKPIADSTWNLIWRFVTNAIDAEKDDWVMNYWTFAEQYYRFFLESAYDDKDDKYKQKLRFKQIHLGLGAYMLYRGKCKLLKKFLYYTQTLPPSYSLMDNSFTEIIEDAKQIYSLEDHQPFELTKRYYMQGLSNDINTDWYIADKFCAYFALLVIRLKDMDFNVCFRNPKEYPSNNGEINNLKNEICIVDRMLYFLKEDKEFQSQTKNLGYDQGNGIEQAVEFLEDYKSKLEEGKHNIEEYPEVDSEKIEAIKQRLVEGINSKELCLPSKNGLSLTDKDILTEISYPRQGLIVPKEDISKGMTRISANLEEALISALRRTEVAIYSRFFLANNPKASYTVRFMDLLKAWEKMDICQNHVILSFGIYLGTFTDIYGEDNKYTFEKGQGRYNGAKILSFQSPLLFFAILPKDNLPYVDFNGISQEQAKKIGLKEIDKVNHLYSNVYSLSPLGKNVLEVCQRMQLNYRRNTKYIILKVKYTTDSSIYDFDKIEDINSLLASCNIDERIC